MKVVTPRPGTLLLDDDAARLARSRGYEPVAVNPPWKRWPWATYELKASNTVTRPALSAFRELVAEYDHIG